MSDEPKLVKVELRSEDGQVETLWAFDLGDHRYKLDNTPWYAYGVSTGDIIEAHRDEPNGFPVFKGVLEKSGYRTLRITSDRDFSDDLLEQIKALGCSFEGATRRYIAIDVPAKVDLSSVTSFLTARDILWEYADPTYEEVHAVRRSGSPPGQS
jgi:hypothetical protein